MLLVYLAPYQSVSLTYLNNERAKHLFAAHGRSHKVDNEIHVLQYNPYIASIASQKIYITDSVIDRIAEDREANGVVLYASHNDKTNSFGVLRVPVDNFMDVTSREDVHKISKEAREKKIQLKAHSSTDVDFRISE